MMPIDAGTTQDVSWATLSEGWPEIREHAYAKCVLAARGVIPYGTYVLMGAQRIHGTGCYDYLNSVLRVETEELKLKLETQFNVVRQAILRHAP